MRIKTAFQSVILATSIILPASSHANTDGEVASKDVRLVILSRGGSTQPSREPTTADIAVTYYEADQSVIVKGYDTFEAEVALISGTTLVDYSPTLDCVLYTNGSGNYTVYISGDGWTGEASFQVP